MSSKLNRLIIAGNIPGLRSIETDITPDDLFSSNFFAFRNAGKFGHSKVIEWIVTKTAEVDMGRTIAGINRAFSEAAKAGHLQLLKFLFSEYDTEPLGFGGGLKNFAFTLAIEYGHLDVVIWLDNFNPSESELAKIRPHIVCAFTSAAENGHFDAVKWAANRFGITREEAHSNDNAAFLFSFENGFIDIYDWLVDAYGI